MNNVLSGKSLKKAKLKDMGDAALFSSSSFFDDNRYKYIELTAANFPVDVTVRILTFSKSNFFLPTWIPIPNYNQKVEKSVFQIRYPKDMEVRYKEINLPGEPLVVYQEGLKILELTLEDLPVQASDNEKIEILYQYLQKNFRYVSIQLGIGGWQTMKAEDVLKYSYGDCEGLTNLMRSMLEVVGISSYYTLVNAGADAKDIEVDFPSNQFNHVILYVPIERDPIWLECTSNALPAGFLGDFTKARHVLVTTPEGGFLTKTPSYSSEDWNKITTKSRMKIDSRGDAKVESQITQPGNFAESLLNVKNLSDEREQKEFFSTGFSVSGLIISQLKMDVNPKDSLLTASVSLEGFLQRYVQQTSKRFILKSFMGKISPSKLDHNYLYQQDELVIQLPEALWADGPLPKVDLEEEHLKGSLSATLEGDRLFLTRELEIHIPNDWSQTQKTEFVRKINAAFDRSIFLSKPSPAVSSN